ncbi:MAG: hypothetical protein M5U34_22755 [Chloroflexi bacterium]|nr:hypothetical protein [Chloroflexota bacterium]
MPARLKFLKSISTEKRLIDEFTSRYALAYPHIRFRLTHNGRITFQTNGSGDLRDVLVAVYGPETARELLEIEDQRVKEAEEAEVATLQSSIFVTGFVGPPSLHWANRSHIDLFLNGRYIKDSSLTYAVTQAYHTLLPTGRYPLGLVFITMPAEEVDVERASHKGGSAFSGQPCCIWRGAKSGASNAHRGDATARHGRVGPPRPARKPPPAGRACWMKMRLYGATTSRNPGWVLTGRRRR